MRATCCSLSGQIMKRKCSVCRSPIYIQKEPEIERSEKKENEATTNGKMQREKKQQRRNAEIKSDGIMCSRFEFYLLENNYWNVSQFVLRADQITQFKMQLQAMREFMSTHTDFAVLMTYNLFGGHFHPLLLILFARSTSSGFAQEAYTHTSIYFRYFRAWISAHSCYVPKFFHISFPWLKSRWQQQIFTLPKSQ